MPFRSAEWLENLAADTTPVQRRGRGIA